MKKKLSDTVLDNRLEAAASTLTYLFNRMEKINDEMDKLGCAVKYSIESAKEANIEPLLSSAKNSSNLALNMAGSALKSVRKLEHKIEKIGLLVKKKPLRKPKRR